MRLYRIVSTLYFTSLGHLCFAEPSFYCGLTDASTVETYICHSKYFSELDIRLARVFTEAANKTTGEELLNLREEQRGWIKGRNDCWKNQDLQSCIENSYNQRTAELQSRYQLVTSTGPVVYKCNNEESNNLAVTFYESTPLSLMAEKDNVVSFMLHSEPSKNFYNGENEYFIGDEKSATVVWGYEAEPLSCLAIQHY